MLETQPGPGEDGEGGWGGRSGGWESPPVRAPGVKSIIGTGVSPTTPTYLVRAVPFVLEDCSLGLGTGP